jgi:hypothetical protein
MINITILSHDWVTTDGVWIGNWIYLTLLIITKSNCSAIANSYTIQFITSCTKSFQSVVSSPVIDWQQLQ